VSKNVTIKLNLTAAALVRQCLFESQKGHSYEFPSARIDIIRSVITDLDEKIGAEVEQ
jgi:hypothetical protein